jgi:uncharacterized protein (DUF2141 family)
MVHLQLHLKIFHQENMQLILLHDENKNGKIDKGFILPKEGIGFSNFQSIGFDKQT